MKAAVIGANAAIKHSNFMVRYKCFSAVPLQRIDALLSYSNA
jgi:hypothetical protein